ncbi:MAG: GntR family transcriptional regulator [Magnetovibrio sp.]|nr:GntR family transcriptional regulator [Magnetovibrio sp.]
MKTPLAGHGPLYRQVHELIVARIVDGQWQPGDLLPSEFDLADEFGVSQGTVRKALNTLAAENLVVRHQGKGTFVAAHTPQRELFHFFHIEGADGARQMPVTSRLLATTNRRASRDEADRLDLPANGHVFTIERIRDLGGRPVIWERIVLPARMFVGLDQLDELPNELYQIYEEFFGVTIHRAIEELRAVAAERAEARHLGLTAGAPLLEVDRLAETVDGTPVEWRLSRCDTRAHHYLSEIV